jgi:hypothetical protein
MIEALPLNYRPGEQLHTAFSRSTSLEISVQTGQGEILNLEGIFNDSKFS